MRVGGRGKNRRILAQSNHGGGDLLSRVLTAGIGRSSLPISGGGATGSPRKLVHKGQLRMFATTSMGRLFDPAAALVGFTREITFEGQAAVRMILPV